MREHCVVTRSVKHATASVFLFASDPDSATKSDVWRLGLIMHPRFGKWMIPGGHVEADENPAEASVREVREETGLPATLVTWPGLALPSVPSVVMVPAPLWIVEQVVPAEKREPTAHVHIDHLFVAVVETMAAAVKPELRFEWFEAAQLAELDMFDGTRSCAAVLFGEIGRLAPTGMQTV